jgi:hypothetical protein
MKKISMQFCPSCGSYWEPGSKEEASRKVEPLCKKCHVKVELSWLGFVLLAVLLCLLFATSLFQGADKIALGFFFVLLGFAAFKAFKQHQALKKMSKNGTST